MTKKLIALFLALCMVCAMIPALAETAAETEVNAEELLAEGEAGDWAALLGGLGAGEGEERGLGDLFGSVLGGLSSGEEGGLGDLFGSVLGGLGSGEEGGLGDLLGSVLGSLGSEEGGLSGLVSSLLGSLFEDGSSLSGLVNSLLGSLSSGDGSGLGAFLGGENADLGTKSIVEGEAVESEDLDAFLSMLSQNDVPANAIKAESAEQFFGTWKLVRAKIGQTEVTVEELGETAQMVLSADSFSMKMEEEYTEAITTELADGALVVTMEGEPVKLYLTDAGELVLALGFMDLYFAPAAAE